ncbi:MAG TPA: hypothetical protein DCR40_04485 [Prolixibacteraceae bacterium]|nr:hypothetical protein [Prolixibacteraceae bacterium]
MNTNNLIRIINKDLEELKTLTSEIAESESDSSLIIDLALSRARLLCQEIELLREVSEKPVTLVDRTEDNMEDDAEDEVSNSNFPDPELEIINFEEQEFSETEDLADEDEIVYDSDEEEDSEEEVQEEEKDEPAEVDEDIALNEEDVEDIEKIQEEEEEEEEEENEEEIEEEEPEELPQPEPTVQINEIKPDSNSKIREIQIEDLDEEEDGTIHFTPVSGPTTRVVMHEIPKPEDNLKEKQVEGETFRKERSLNDVISENKPAEANLGNVPISSLRSSIGLNDRFLFIREIFSNNTDKYNLVIDHLDKLETIQQAVDYLKANLTLQKNETSLKFVDLLKRRFTK